MRILWLLHSVHPPPHCPTTLPPYPLPNFVEPPTRFSKREGLDRTLIFRGGDHFSFWEGKGEWWVLKDRNGVFEGEGGWYPNAHYVFNLKLEQAMRNLTCSDQKILLVVIWLVLRRKLVTDNCICVSLGLVCSNWNCMYLFQGIVTGMFQFGKMGWLLKEEILNK